MGGRSSKDEPKRWRSSLEKWGKTVSLGTNHVSRDSHFPKIINRPTPELRKGRKVRRILTLSIVLRLNLSFLYDLAYSFSFRWARFDRRSSHNHRHRKYLFTFLVFFSTSHYKFTDLTVGVPSAGTTPVSQGFTVILCLCSAGCRCPQTLIPIIVDFTVYSYYPRLSYRGWLFTRVDLMVIILNKGYHPMLLG